MIGAVEDQLEPGRDALMYLREWLKWYLPKWRNLTSKYPKANISTPREEFICWHKQLETEYLDWRLYITEAEGSGLVYGDGPVPSHVAPDEMDPIRGSDEYYVYKNNRGDVVHRFPVGSITIGSR